ncbi:MAG: hypothetical protein U0Z53_31925 [Blastocatellia bacterium]
MSVFRTARTGLLILSMMLVVTAPLSAQGKGSDARAAVQDFFNLLKAKKYAQLYDYLPGEMQQQMTREQLTQALKRLDDFIIIERLEIGRVQQRTVSGTSFAVIDTTLYGQLKRPVEINGQKVETGKVIVQQYLFREGSQWKVATADGQTRARFLKRYPEFARSFQLSPPQFFLKQNGQWKSFTRR